MKSVNDSFNKLSGLLLLDKPRGLSSNRALQIVKKSFHFAKAGHTGSLDPLAEGMLPICLGEATKFASFLLDDSKTYEVEAVLGFKSTTGDSEGEISKFGEVPDNFDHVLAQVLPSFIGEIKQIPPMYSALKYRGTPLYKLARKGIEISRSARNIFIYSIQLKGTSSVFSSLQSMTNEIEDFSNKPNKIFHFKFIVNCSKGTYIRTLVEDIGNVMGCGAYVSKLRRLSVGGFKQDAMITLEALQSLSLLEINNYIFPISSMLVGEQFSDIILSDNQIKALIFGQKIVPPIQKLDISNSQNTYLRLYDEKKIFYGLGKIDEDGFLISKRLISS